MIKYISKKTLNDEVFKVPIEDELEIAKYHKKFMTLTLQQVLQKRWHLHF